mmetsp:Transcript_28529/g.21315  ORF Transcript_28529/g.21315 Transcript_28529/m.21315 type:complete len:119 (-) Transcript_28529:238-594(-)
MLRKREVALLEERLSRLKGEEELKAFPSGTGDEAETLQNKSGFGKGKETEVMDYDQIADKERPVLLLGSLASKEEEKEEEEEEDVDFDVTKQKGDESKEIQTSFCLLLEQDISQLKAV